MGARDGDQCKKKGGERLAASVKETAQPSLGRHPLPPGLGPGRATTWPCSGVRVAVGYYVTAPYSCFGFLPRLHVFRCDWSSSCLGRLPSVLLSEL